MTDHELPANLTEEEVERARRWAEGIEANPKSWSLLTRTAARVILDAVPTPPLPTLADMTDEERAACQWMQTDVANHSVRYVIVNPCDEDGDAELVSAEGRTEWFSPDRVTPRPDLPRMEWPGTEKPAPAPALPEGWRLADHQKHGRVIVTDPTPNRDGYVYCVFPAGRDSTGFDWHPYDPEALTYLDTDQEADTVPESTLAVGSVWDDADALARACEETGRDQITVTDCEGDVYVWDARRDDWRDLHPIQKYAPYTILHAGKKADQ